MIQCTFWVREVESDGEEERWRVRYRMEMKVDQPVMDRTGLRMSLRTVDLGILAMLWNQSLAAWRLLILFRE